MAHGKAAGYHGLWISAGATTLLARWTRDRQFARDRSVAAQQLLEQALAQRPVAEIALGIDVADSAGVGEQAAPVERQRNRAALAALGIVR